MGIFDSGNAKEFAENELLQKLSKSAIIADIVYTLQSKYPWTIESVDYYDDRKRTVFVNSNMFCIKMEKQILKTNGMGQSGLESDGEEFLGLNFTKSGYKPMSTYTASNGKVVELNRVVYQFAKVMQNEMQSIFKDCEFESVFSNDNVSRFSYKVPGVELKDWF